MTVESYDGVISGGERRYHVVPMRAGTGRSEPDEARRTEPGGGVMYPQVPVMTPE